MEQFSLACVQPWVDGCHLLILGGPSSAELEPIFVWYASGLKECLNDTHFIMEKLRGVTTISSVSRQEMSRCGNGLCGAM